MDDHRARSPIASAHDKTKSPCVVLDAHTSIENGLDEREKRRRSACKRCETSGSRYILSDGELYLIGKPSHRGTWSNVGPWLEVLQECAMREAAIDPDSEVLE